MGPKKCEFFVCMQKFKVDRCGILFSLYACCPDSACDTFVVGAPADEYGDVLRAMLEGGERTFSEYECQCGYKYLIGECGKPMQTSTCPNCKNAIGGRGHTPELNQTQKARVNRKTASKSHREQQGFIVASNDSRHLGNPIRGMKAVPALLLDVLVHMSIDLARHFSLEGQRMFIRKKVPDVVAHCQEHINVCWRRLRRLLNISDEDLSIIFHDIILDLPLFCEAQNNRLTSAQGRSMWEHNFDQWVQRYVSDTATTRQLFKIAREPLNNTFHCTFLRILKCVEFESSTCV